MKIKNLVLVSLFAAIVSVLSIISIPLPTPVPFTLQIFAVSITGALLGSYLGSISLIIYTLLGAIGIPVFAGMNGGIHILVGPTGGYIFGFIVSAFIIGFGMEQFVHKQSSSLAKFITIFLTMLLGLLASYTLGTIQLKFVTGLSWTKAVAAGVIPFFGLDLVKVIFSTVVVQSVHPILIKSNLVPNK